MKILHISTYDAGGAAVAAIRLHNALNKSGNVESTFLYLYGTSGDVKESICYSSTIDFHVGRLLRFLRLMPSVWKQNQKYLAGLNGSFEAYSFPQSDFQKLHMLPACREADIIHLHWVADFLDWQSFFAAVHQPMVWTLHDCNPFLGGFHYSCDVDRNQSTFVQLEQRLISEKVISLLPVSNLHVVSPSRWMMKKAQNSEVLGRFTHHHIANGLSADQFGLHEQTAARLHHKLPSDKKILLFVSADVTNNRKGFYLLWEAFRRLGSADEYMLVAVGNDKTNGQYSGVYYTGSVQSEPELALLYAAADVTILPSREDNLPNVLLESLYCGTPVICFASGGGHADIIESGFNGELALDLTADSLCKAIVSFFEKQHLFNRKAIRQKAIEHFADDRQSAKYIQLYRSLV